MEFILSRFRNLTILLVVILAQLVLLAYQVKSNQDVPLIRVWSVTAVTPIAKVLEVLRHYTIGFVEDYFVLVHVREDNRRLQEESGKLKMENQFLRTELQTADRAQALSAFQSRTPSRTIPARIIGTGTGVNSKVVFVDQGTSKGVQRGMAVVTPDGIVGRVLASYPTASQVLLVTDPTFAAGVISQKNRVHGTLKGNGQSKCLIDYVQNEEKVEVGEVFYTSGDDRVFPKGMPAARVTAVRNGEGSKQIFVVPTGFQNGLEEVLIVLEGVHQSIPEMQAAAPAQDVYLAPPVQEEAKPAVALPLDPAALSTTADKIHERYKKIGEQQHHTYGEGAPGSTPPNFNVDPDKAPAPAPPAPKPSLPAGSSAAPATVKPKPPVTSPESGGAGAGAQPPAAVPGTGPATAKPKPKPPIQSPDAAGSGASIQPAATRGAGSSVAPPAAKPKPKPPVTAPATGAPPQ